MRGRKNGEKALATVIGTVVVGRTLAVDWAVEKEVWESQNKSAGADEEDAKDEDSDGGAPLKKEKPESENEEVDVSYFMRNLGDEL
jgi:nucleolar protein 4